MEWYLKVVKENYSNFNGRARRKEYWMFLLFNMIFVIAAVVLDNILGLNFKFEMNTTGLASASASLSLPYGWIYVFYSLAVFIPGLAVFVRRMHDVGRSGWFCLIMLIPIIGAILLLVLLCTDGQAEDNEYGANPKTEEAVA